MTKYYKIEFDWGALAPPSWKEFWLFMPVAFFHVIIAYLVCGLVFCILSIPVMCLVSFMQWLFSGGAPQ